MDKKILKQLKNAKAAEETFGLLSLSKRNKILKNLARLIKKNKKSILSANTKDLKRMKKDDPMYDRLVLNDKRIEGMIKEINNLSKMPDPIGEIFDERKGPGIEIKKKRVPLGVVAVIYESRPNVTTDVAAICIKSGNVAVLKGGKEARESSLALHKLIQKSLEESRVSKEAVQLIDPKIKNAAESIISADGWIDLIVPRGSERLIKFVRENAIVPVIETGAGVCHTFVDESAKLDDSAKIIFNAKTERPSVCNALDTAVIHEKISEKFIPKMAQLLSKKDVEIFADSKSYKILEKVYPVKLLRRAQESDFGKEFLSLKMSVKIVSDFNEALRFIKKYSSHHSEAILTENKKNAERFLKEIDAATVYVNASTRFSDGAIFGLGSEIGISTSKLHARGPMGPKEMTTYKWLVSGKYSVRK